MDSRSPKKDFPRTLTKMCARGPGSDSWTVFLWVQENVCETWSGKEKARKEKRSVSSTKTIEDRPGACCNYPEDRRGLGQAGGRGEDRLKK